MTKYIDVEAFKRKLIDEKSFFPAIVAKALEEMPEADVKEVKHEYYEYDAVEGQSFCSVCESPKPSNGGDIRGNEVLYCYYCGAKMDGGTKHE
jgi:hypothetical protein